MTLYLYNYNNYYNRIVKREETINNYGMPLSVFYGINFIVGDGLRTTQIVNYSGTLPDYLVVCDDSETKIESRWFVLKTTQLRNGQYHLELLRDIVADWYPQIITAPMFIEKATVALGDVAIYNNENMTYNQIKKKETKLMDASKIPWIVGYLAKDANLTEDIVIPAEGAVDASYNTLNDYSYYKYDLNNPLYLGETITDQLFVYRYYTATSHDPVVAIDTSGAFAKPSFATTDANYSSGMYKSIVSNHDKGYQVPADAGNTTKAIMEKSREIVPTINWSSYSYTQASFTNFTNSSLSDIMKENGKVIQVGTQYYKVKVSSNDPVYLTATIPVDSAVGLQMAKVTKAVTTLKNPKQPVYQMEVRASSVYFEMIPTTISSMKFTMPTQTNRTNTADAPYDVFAIPYGEMYLETNQGVHSLKKSVDPSISMKLARALQLQLGASGSAATKLYDIQLLPYCPLEDIFFSPGRVGSLNLPSLYVYNLAEKDYTVCEHSSESGEYRSIVLWLKKSNFTKYTSSGAITTPTDPIEFKVANECDMYRLCSPNWNGAFEFSATKNGGVKMYRIDASYKPISPYIRIAPSFGGLYGTIADDARGLICGGDFSLAQVSDDWLNYQRQNTNFQQIFDRQIENMEINNSIQRELEMANVLVGAAQAGVTTGTIVGGINPSAGILAGGAAGILSGMAGARDIYLNEKLRQEALDYTKDQFGYQLGNIKALPQSLAKVSSFNPNNKVFPVLEYYTCSDTEKEALRNKIKYNGMTVMRIGTLSEFKQNEPSYIKGKLIRLEVANDNFDILTRIADELYKGVYI